MCIYKHKHKVYIYIYIKELLVCYIYMYKNSGSAVHMSEPLCFAAFSADGVSDTSLACMPINPMVSAENKAECEPNSDSGAFTVDSIIEGAAK